MLRLAADENFNGRIVRALQRRVSGVDLIRIQDTAISGADDATVLQWPSDQHRVLLTHDVSTLIGYAYERIEAGQPMAGVVAVQASAHVGQIVADLELMLLASGVEEVEGRIIYLPL